ncbi:MAG: threonine synthase [Clostridia bacterium]|nr:threonine synthase [Clostridia bacterium]
MKFFSTRNPKICRTPSEAIAEGIAPDGGLYLPESFPVFPMEALSSMSGDDISVAVLSRLFDDFTENELRRAVTAAYDESFENGDIAPLAEAGDAHIMELWHGPTCAFKDVALSLLPHLLTASAKKCGITDEICILTATSGDTGSAALSGFSDVPGTRIIVFFPDGGVSPAQKKQMVTCPGKNTAVCAVRGNFDDAQSGVKAIFTGEAPAAGMRFSSANSINIGRLAPQIAYYFKAYRDLLAKGRIKMGESVNFVVPTGNFGDILAGYFAKKMGLPVARFVCASNRNRVLADFFESGLYDRRREFHLTSSPSMDILISSNLERLLCMFVGTDKTAALMQDLKEKGMYQLEGDTLAALRAEFSAAWADEAETAAAIRSYFEKYGYLADPHTAVGICAYEKWKASEEANDHETVILSTASPYKFSRHVLAALGVAAGEDEFADMEKLSEISGMKIPAPLASLVDKKVCHTAIVDIDEMPAYVRGKTEEKEWNV